MTGLDNFATGSRLNFQEVHKNVGDAAWQRFPLMHADITELGTCKRALQGIDHVLHQAALGSVPRSRRINRLQCCKRHRVS